MPLFPKSLLPVLLTAGVWMMLPLTEPGVQAEIRAAQKSGTKPARPQTGVTVKFVLSGGTKVSDVVTLEAKVTTPENVTVQEVQFLVDGELKGSDSSVPYTFDWDTLSVSEGEHLVTATVLDSRGKTQSVKISLVVDNELSKGADFHANAAIAELKDKNVEMASKYARRALKIAPNNLTAARALAAVYREKGELGQAIATLEKVMLPDTDTAVRADLAALYIARGAIGSSIEEFLQNADQAAQVASKITAIRLNAKAEGAEGAILRGDALGKARQWTGAEAAYQNAGSADDAPIAASNRLLLAYVQNGHTKEANYLIGLLNRNKKADDVTRAVIGLMLLKEYKPTEARAMVQGGVTNHVLPSLLVAAYAELMTGQRRNAIPLINQAYTLAPRLVETNLLRSYVLTDPLDADKATLRAIEIDPTLPEGYAARGLQTLLSKDKTRFVTADALFGYALKRDPKNEYALVSSALSLVAQKKYTAAEPILAQVAAEDKNAPDVLTLLATVLQEQGKTMRVGKMLETARRVDPVRWNDTLTPKGDEAILRVYRYRFSPIFSPEVLYSGTSG